MSYVSCSNSALADPSSYPPGARGALIRPAFNAPGTPIDTGTLSNLWASNVLLPKGVWQVSGCINFDAVDPANLLIGSCSLNSLQDGVTTQVWGVRVEAPSAVNTISVYPGAVIVSDGTTEVFVRFTYTVLDNANPPAPVANGKYQVLPPFGGAAAVPGTVYLTRIA